MTTRMTEISARATGLPVQAIREVMELAWRQPDAIHLQVGELPKRERTCALGNRRGFTS